MSRLTQSTVQSPEQSLTADNNENKFLTFHLGNEEYAVGILRIREIIGMMDVTPLPKTPEHVKGVINLRGKIIPVIDLRRKFELPAVEYTQETCIIVVEVTDPAGVEQYQIGVIVDNVSEVLDIARDQIEPAPNFGSSVNTEFVRGLGKTRDRVITLLEIDRVLAMNELERLNDRIAVVEESGGGQIAGKAA